MKSYVARAIAKAFVAEDPKALEFMEIMRECVTGRKNIMWGRIAQCELMNHLHL